MIYKYKYKTPKFFSNIIMTSYGEYLVQITLNNYKKE